MARANRTGSRRPAQPWRDRRSVYPSSSSHSASAEGQQHAIQFIDVPQALLELQSDDIGKRLQAFSQLRHVHRPTLRMHWDEVRQLIARPGRALDCLERLEIEPPNIQCDRAIITVVTPGYENMATTMLDSLRRFGDTPEATIVVFCVGEAFANMAMMPGITRIRCHAIERNSPAVKGALYSASRFINARSFISLEADMLIVGSLQPLWSLIENSRANSLMGCRAQLHDERFTLSKVLDQENAPPSDLKFLTNEEDYNSLFWFNGGLLCGQRAAFNELDSQLAAMMPFVSMWIDGALEKPFGDELAMNVAAGLMENIGELAGCWNVQFYDLNRDHWLHTERTPDGLKFSRLGETARVLHFLSPNRALMSELVDDINRDGLSN